MNLYLFKDLCFINKCYASKFEKAQNNKDLETNMTLTLF